MEYAHIRSGPRRTYSEMRQKPAPKDTFFNLINDSQQYRPTSVTTEFVDTDWDEEETVLTDGEAESSPRGSFQSSGQTTLDSFEEAVTPRSSHHEHSPKQIEGPSGPHLFHSVTASDYDYYHHVPAENPPVLGMSPITPKPRGFGEVTVHPPLPLPQDGPFQYTREELDAADLVAWTPEMVAQSMLDSGIEMTVADRFIENDINGPILMTLKFEDLRELDIPSFGMRTKIWHRIQRLCDGAQKAGKGRGRGRGSEENEEDESRPSTPIEDRPSREVRKEERKEEQEKYQQQQQQQQQRRGSPNDMTGSNGDGAGDNIMPHESVSIIGIEQVIPKPHKCSKGENCSKWRKQQRLIADFRRLNPHIDMSATGRVLICGDSGDADPATARAIDPNEDLRVLLQPPPHLSSSSSSSPAQQPTRPISDAAPSLVASSDILGTDGMPPLQYLREASLRGARARDAQDNVRQFLSFQRTKNALTVSSSSSPSPSSPPSLSSLEQQQKQKQKHKEAEQQEVPPTPPFELVVAQPQPPAAAAAAAAPPRPPCPPHPPGTAPHHGLRRLPKLSIPLNVQAQRCSTAGVAEVVAAAAAAARRRPSTLQQVSPQLQDKEDEDEQVVTRQMQHLSRHDSHHQQQQHQHEHQQKQQQKHQHQQSHHRHHHHQRTTSHEFVPYRMDKVDPKSPDLETPRNPYRWGTPFSERDLPVTAVPLGPIARDASQSVPPDMGYRVATASSSSSRRGPSPPPSQPPRSQSRASYRRPSFPVLPALNENRVVVAASASAAAAALPPASSSYSSPLTPSPTSQKEPPTSTSASSSPPPRTSQYQRAVRRLLPPPRGLYPWSSSSSNLNNCSSGSQDDVARNASGSTPSLLLSSGSGGGGGGAGITRCATVTPAAPPPPPAPIINGVSFQGPMKKRRTRLLRTEWQDGYFTLKGTRLNMHKDVAAVDHTLEYIDIDDYAIACSSLAVPSSSPSSSSASASSRLTAAFKTAVSSSSSSSSHHARQKSDPVGAFSFQLIPQDKHAARLRRRESSVVGGGTAAAEGVDGTGKTHHFAVKNRDERIDWMREMMLAKALKQKGDGFEISVNGNMI